MDQQLWICIYIENVSTLHGKKALALDAQKSMCFAVIPQIVKLKIGIHFDTKLKRTPKKKLM